MRIVAVVCTIAALAAGATPVDAAPSASCAERSTAPASPIRMWLSGLSDASSPSHPLYIAAEDAGEAPFEISAGADVCGETATVRYAASPVTAIAPEDYAGRAGTASFLVIHTAAPVRVDVPLVADGDVERAVERFDVQLSSPENGSVREPSGVPYLVVDVDGDARASFDAARYRAEEVDGTVRLVVLRAGADDLPLDVAFAVDPGETTPDDLTVETPSPLRFDAGQRVATIDVSLTADTTAEPDESFLVSLDASGEGVERTAEVTIASGVDDRAPTSRFHHPRDGWTYDAQDYRIREIHVFTRDGAGSGTVLVEIALRRNDRDGSCAWWTGRRFASGACADPVWEPMDAFDPGWFYYYRIDPLAPSVGTGIRSYTAFSRARDGAGNLERRRGVGDNRNTFEVTPA